MEKPAHGHNHSNHESRATPGSKDRLKYPWSEEGQHQTRIQEPETLPEGRRENQEETGKHQQRAVSYVTAVVPTSGGGIGEKYAKPAHAHDGCDPRGQTQTSHDC